LTISYFHTTGCQTGTSKEAILELRLNHAIVLRMRCLCMVKQCYRATCYATTRLLAKELGLSPQDYSVAFQSRLDKNWMEPFTDEVLLAKLKEGKKRILVFAPAFVTDCLETIIEIGDEYREIFLENGGERLQLVESLNSGINGSIPWQFLLKR
jgi:protoheme ferro-lyase